MSALDGFTPPVRAWFEEAFGAPTAAQEQGWPPIQAGAHTLILSPTGSGKTLAAFLWGLDRLFAEGPERPRGVRLLYISPLKALNNDIERNLRRPLEGIRAAAERLGRPLPELRVAVRTGDTPARARAAMVKKPPHILITTPESFYLMLSSSQAREIFRTVSTVIVDEIHTVAGNKRGVHLAVSLERLVGLVDGPLQRIGLSATQRPLEEVAHFLGGQEWQGGPDGERRLAPRPVTIVDAGSRRPIDLQVVTVVEDFHTLGGSIWQAVEQQVADLIRRHRTTLVFCNGRRQAERLAAHLSDQLPVRIRAHHGSTAAAARLEMEAELKAGQLPALVGTSSLELGIDIGSVDLVVQLQSPKGVARGLQRVGRSGHLVGQTPIGRIFATYREDLMEAAAVAGAMLRGEVEPTRVPQNCLDVLAQQIVAAVSVESWSEGQLYDMVRRSYPYRDLPLSAYHEVLAMLGGKYPSEIARELRPRLDWDRAAGRLNPLPGSGYLARTSGGTIADRGAFGVYLPDGTTRIGELDEEFVYERRVGDSFTLGSHSWRIDRIDSDRVVVSDRAGQMPMVPFWHGDVPWRPYELGREVGRFRREVAERVDDPDVLDWLRREHALDEPSARNVLNYVREQLEATGAISSDRTVIVELFHDALGDPRLVIQSPFGGRVNAAWALALRHAFRERLHVTPETLTNCDGILLRFPESDQDPPVDLVTGLTPAEARERILEELPDSAVFGAQFRQNAARALLMPRGKHGRRTPFWLQRLRAKDLLAATRQFESFPIVVETYRDCLSDVLDLEHLLEVLAAIQRGEIRVVTTERAAPSPVAAGLLYYFEATYMYEWDAPKAERQLHGLALDRDLLQELLRDVPLSDLLRPEALAALEAGLQHTAQGRRARTPSELALLFAELGDLSAAEVEARTEEGGRRWLADLAAQGRVVERDLPTSAGPVHRWLLAEEVDLYQRAFDWGDEGPEPQEARATLLRRLLATHGPLTREAILARYAFPEAWLDAALAAWVESGEGARGRLSPGVSGVEWCDRRSLEQAHRRTLTLLRREIQPVLPAAYVDFLSRWQHVHPLEQLPYGAGLRQAIQQLRGFPAPALLWERDLLPARVRGFRPAELDALCQGGEVAWVGSGNARPSHLRARLLFRGEGALFLPPALADNDALTLSAAAQKVLAFLGSEGACFTADIERGTGLRGDVLDRALVELVAAGLVANDSLRALREVVHYHPGASGSRPSLSALEQELAARRPQPFARRPGRLYEARRRVARRLGAAPQWVGRWSLVHRVGIWGEDIPPEERVARQARQLLARYGVLCRDCLARERGLVSWEELYHCLDVLEMRGEVRRGYFVQGLAGAQFALPEAVERLREWSAIPEDEETPLIVLNACDPAAALLGQVAQELLGTDGAPLTVPRRPSTSYVLRRGRPLLVAERWGRSILAPAGVAEGDLVAALRACFGALSARQGRRRFAVEAWNGAPALGSSAQGLLEAAGCYPHAPAMEWQAP